MEGDLLQSRHAALAGTLLALAGCGLINPYLDPDMSGADHRACGSLAPEANGDEPQCFAMNRVSDSELRVILRGGADCAGDYRHATVTGSSDGPGSLNVVVSSPTAAGLPGRSWQWRQGFARRTFVVRDVGTTFLIPNAAIIRHDPGFRFEQVCFAAW